MKQYKETHQVPEKLKRGAPKKLTNEVLVQINQMILNNAKVSLTEMAFQISNKQLFNISKSTVERDCQVLRYKYQPPQRTIYLTNDQKKFRVLFSKTMISMIYKQTVDQYKIIFSDESRFVLGDDKQWVWQRSMDIHSGRGPLSYIERNNKIVEESVRFYQKVACKLA